MGLRAVHWVYVTWCSQTTVQRPAKRNFAPSVVGAGTRKIKLNRFTVLLSAIALFIAAISVYLSFRLLDPTPPKTLILATGKAGSAYEEMGKSYRKTLKESGVEVQLLASGGALENLELLKSGEADIGFLTMGYPAGQDAVNLRSLGAMFFEPLWVFTQDNDLLEGNLDSLRRTSISIGPSKSRSNSASRNLFEINGLDISDFNLFELDPITAAQQLKQGKLDTLFIVGNSISPVIKQLLSSRDSVLVDFERADAYVALFPELTKLIVPAGVGDLALNMPSSDTRLLAFTAMLGVNKDLHPITQSLVLEAAERVHAKPDLFHQASVFPQARDQLIILSDSAKAYYADGRPLLLRFLPYPVAVFFMQLMAAAIPLLAIAYPMFKLLPAAFHWIMRRQFYRVYSELRRIDRSIGNITEAELKMHLERLESLEQKVTGLKVPITYSTMLYALKGHIGSVLKRVRDALG